MREYPSRIRKRGFCRNRLFNIEHRNSITTPVIGREVGGGVLARFENRPSNNARVGAKTARYRRSRRRERERIETIPFFSLSRRRFTCYIGRGARKFSTRASVTRFSRIAVASPDAPGVSPRVYFLSSGPVFAAECIRTSYHPVSVFRPLISTGRARARIRNASAPPGCKARFGSARLESCFLYASDRLRALL